MLKAEEMRSLPQFFADIPDPRRTHGRRHGLPTVLSIAAGAVLCGMRGYKAISDWANSLGQKARERFRCRREHGSFVVPSEYVIRDVLIRVDPLHLDRALQCWNRAYGKKGDEEAKRTNEIKMAIPLLDAIDIEGKVITADALLTQREFVGYLVLKRKAHYHFTVKRNQPTLLADLELYFRNRGEPDFILNDPPRPRANRNPQDLGHHRAQRLPQFPTCSAGVRD